MNLKYSADIDSSLSPMKVIQLILTFLRVADRYIYIFLSRK